MVIKTMKFTRKKAVLLIIILAVILTAVIMISGSESKLSTGSVKSNEDRVKYLSKLGWEVDADSVEKKEVMVPQNFDDVFSAYNDLQRQQGFDLAAYCGKQIVVYTYKVTNYPLEGDVLAVIYVSGGKVIAGDIHSASLDGFMHGLTRK